MKREDKIAIGVVDKIGALDAQIAALKVERDALAESLKNAGAGTYEGVVFDAVVSDVERSVVDWKAIAKKLEPSRQLVAAHTSVSSYVRLQLVSK